MLVTLLCRRHISIRRWIARLPFLLLQAHIRIHTRGLTTSCIELLVPKLIELIWQTEFARAQH